LGKQSSTASKGKHLGLPNNDAVVTSMLFRTHHTVDTRTVETKIKAKEGEDIILRGYWYARNMEETVKRPIR
jgi:hypothetical protein